MCLVRLKGVILLIGDSVCFVCVHGCLRLTDNQSVGLNMDVCV